jgi:histone deacetylase 8
MRERASGFCYVNDCVLVVLGLLKGRVERPLRKSGNGGLDGREADDDDRPRGAGRKPRILYLDLDVHFGDGVAQSFISPLSPSSLASQQPSVLTLSLHHTAPSFFPFSPLASLTPSTTSHPHSLSLPLKLGTSSKTMTRVWEECVEKVRRSWQPDWVVCCLGVDGMAGDGEKTGVWNLGCGEEEGELGWCVKQVLGWEEDGVKGTVLLGGGE